MSLPIHTMLRFRMMTMTDEGLRLTVYDDATGKPIRPGSLVVGHPTIGYGRALDVNGISQPVAILLLDQDVKRVEAEAATLRWFSKLNEARQVVVMCMLFNLGLTKFLKFEKMIRHLQTERWELAAAEMLDSDWSAQVGARARALSEMMRSGQYPS